MLLCRVQEGSGRQWVVILAHARPPLGLLSLEKNAASLGRAPGVGWNLLLKGSQSFQILHINTHSFGGGRCKNKTLNLQETILGKAGGGTKMDKTYGPQSLNKQELVRKGQPSLGLREKSQFRTLLGKAENSRMRPFLFKAVSLLVLRKVNFKKPEAER